MGLDTLSDAVCNMYVTLCLLSCPRGEHYPTVSSNLLSEQNNSDIDLTTLIYLLIQLPLLWPDHQ